MLAELARPTLSPLTLLVGPAGHGKTTVLAQHLARHRGQTIRWRPGRGTAEVGEVLEGIARRLRAPLPLPRVSVEALALVIERQDEPVLLAIDDLHLVHGTPAEAAVEELLLLAPPNLRVVAAGRRRPLVNLARRELADTTVLGPAALRLRTEEIEPFLDARLAPGLATALGTLTLGWPAVLRLLRPALARPPGPQPQPEPGGGARPEPTELLAALARGYLDREVLDPLPARLVRLLERVSPVSLLSPVRCEELAGDPDSGRLLGELADDYGLLEHGPVAGTYQWIPLLRDRLIERSTTRRAPPVPRAAATPPAATSPPGRAGRVELRCFGGFELALGGRTLDWRLVRPRARALLRLLAIHPGRPVHRELLMEALWPHLPPDTAARSLQVAVSALRTFLEPGAGRGEARLLLRTGEAYLFRVPAPGGGDLQRFESALAEALRARAAGRRDAAAHALRTALDAYTGELLPEDGPAEWVVGRREHYRSEAAGAALTLAGIELARGRPHAAAGAGARSVEIDPFREEAWRTLITAQERCGDPAAAERSRLGRARMLLSLGLPAGPGAKGTPGSDEVTAVRGRRHR
ncbi:BTAD domain-containing putative transcriptional regulator [Kitasatospora sp. NPDC097643]|uniref:BTAD domain-containing putative transcriptional regulator n=1 Tax=Kitasatospora sp. NPDC097643 TaxID=3157230 RepID=UPI00332878EF